MLPPIKNLKRCLSSELGIMTLHHVLGMAFATQLSPGAAGRGMLPAD